MPMEFFKTIERASFLSPPDFNQVSEEMEYRKDSLTGISCRINRRRLTRYRKQTSVEPLKGLTEKRGDCPFCPENILSATPTFNTNFVEKGRICRGEACIFPNLFPITKYHATATLSQRHFINLGDFTAQQIIDNFVASVYYISQVYKFDQDACFPTLIWNHLPASAASIIHPHTQSICLYEPTPYQNVLIMRSREYFQSNNRIYWEELAVEEEKRAERFIQEYDALWVIASYAPQANREIQFIFKNKSSLTGLDSYEGIFSR